MLVITVLTLAYIYHYILIYAHILNACFKISVYYYREQQLPLTMNIFAAVSDFLHFLCPRHIKYVNEFPGP